MLRLTYACYGAFGSRSVIQAGGHSWVPGLSLKYQQGTFYRERRKTRHREEGCHIWWAPISKLREMCLASFNSKSSSPGFAQMQAYFSNVKILLEMGGSGLLIAGDTSRGQVFPSFLLPILSM